MSIAVTFADTDKLGVTIEGVPAWLPRSMMNADYQRLYELGLKKIELTLGVYNAFPSWMLQRGASLAFIFSSGAGHANSDRQIGIRTDDNFETFSRTVFFENATGVYDNSFLDGMLETGEVFPAKNVFKVRKTAGGYENKVQSTIAVTGQGSNDGTFAFWSAKPIEFGGKLYCTGYRTSPTPFVSALFESSNGGWDWTFTTIIASDAALLLGETAICQYGVSDFLAVIRDDAGAGRPLYVCRSLGSITNWGAHSLISEIQGVQPSLTPLPDGDILLTVGHRTGSSGFFNASNRMRDELNITGIVTLRSTNNGATWPNRVNLAPMWSTDGGQPMPSVLSSGLVGFPCYLAPGATNGDSGVEPGIYLGKFNGDNIV
jgi:hypothetical protein